MFLLVVVLLAAVVVYNVTVDPGPPFVSNFPISGLAGGTSYSLRLSAVNSAGVSEQFTSGSAFTTLPAVLPSAPSSVVVTSTSASTVILSFSQPVDLGGSPLLRYTVTVSTDALTFTPAVVSATYVASIALPAGTVALKVIGLAADSVYFFRVRAVTAVGSGPQSPVTLPVWTSKPTVPSTPGTPLASGNISASTALLRCARCSFPGYYLVFVACCMCA
jgi:hypothetical protein